MLYNIMPNNIIGCGKIIIEARSIEGRPWEESSPVQPSWTQRVNQQSQAMSEKVMCL